MLSLDCRHRLGLTVVGACSAARKPYGSRLQTVRPCGLVISAFSIVPRKPRAASSKSRVSENGSALSIAVCCAMTDGVAPFGSLVEVSGISISSPPVARHLTASRGRLPSWGPSDSFPRAERWRGYSVIADYMPNSLGSHSDRPGQYVTTTRNPSIVSSHGH